MNLLGLFVLVLVAIAVYLIVAAATGSGLFALVAGVLVLLLGAASDARLR